MPRKELKEKKTSILELGTRKYYLSARDITVQNEKVVLDN